MPLSQEFSKFCDLHLHSHCSDGTDSPTELVRKAKVLGLGAIALTDHDTMNGVAEALVEGKVHGVKVIAGVELSVESPSGPIHLLGYGCSTESQPLRDAMERIVRGRDERNALILEKLARLGKPLMREELAVSAVDGEVIGRPHIARAMLERGYVKSMDEAFQVYLKRNAKAYADRYRPTSAEAIEWIHRAGGVAVLAHPGFCKHIAVSPVELVDIVRPERLDGVECYYTYHTVELTERLLARCKKHSLLATGGSDYHGSTKPQVQLGIGAGRLRVPIELAYALIGASA